MRVCALGDEPRRVQAVQAARQRGAVARLAGGRCRRAGGGGGGGGRGGRPVVQARAPRQAVRQAVRDREPPATLQLRQHYYHLPDNNTHPQPVFYNFLWQYF